MCTGRTIEEIGATQNKKYVSPFIDNRTAAIHRNSKNSSATVKQVCKAAQKLTAATLATASCSVVFIPPSLSGFLNLRSTKSDLIECLTKRITQNFPPESYDVKVFELAAFLGDAGNKKELFQFLTLQVSRYSFPAYKHVIIISGKD